MSFFLMNLKKRAGVAVLFRILPMVGLLLLAGCQSQPKVEPLFARFHLEVRPGEPGLQALLPVSGTMIVVGERPVLAETDVAGIEVVKVQMGWGLVFTFKAAAAQDLYRMSVAAPQRRLVASFNNVPVAAIRLDQPVANGRLLLFAEVPDVDLPPIAERIRRTSLSDAERRAK